MKGETLARALGVTKSCISQMEHGLVNIKISSLLEIAKALEININALLPADNSYNSF